MFRTKDEGDQLTMGDEVGTFWLMKTNDIFIQARYWKAKTHAFSILGALAVGGEFLNNNVLTIRSNIGNITWNDQAVLQHSNAVFKNIYVEARSHQDSELVANGKKGHGIDINFPNGFSLVVNRWKASLNVKLRYCAADADSSEMTGQCGNFDGDARDDTMQLVMPRILRVPQEEILFLDGRKVQWDEEGHIMTLHVNKSNTTTAAPHFSLSVPKPKPTVSRGQVSLAAKPWTLGSLAAKPSTLPDAEDIQAAEADARSGRNPFAAYQQ